jgi:peptidoglycan/xylan/chitin deacetylase (PgdA/CDA1 family)
MRAMNENKKSIFFRNDDVRGTLDQSLIDLTMLCIEHKVPISHAVEPSNITPEVTEWLIGVKKQFPDFIEIIQHGYNHNLTNPAQKMEFGGDRGYQEQYDDIQKGKEIMDRTFGNLWDPIFTFPYGTYNEHTLRAVDDLGYKAISSKIKFTYKGRIKNRLGRLLGKDMLLGKNINYHPEVRNRYKFREISVSANLIKRYTGESTADHFSHSEIMEQIRISGLHTNIIGVLFHHRFHVGFLNLTADLIGSLKEIGYSFSKIREIIQ